MRAGAPFYHLFPPPTPAPRHSTRPLCSFMDREARPRVSASSGCLRGKLAKPGLGPSPWSTAQGCSSDPGAQPSTGSWPLVHGPALGPSL